MSRRYQCRSCRTSFVSHDQFVGRPVICPKCGADQEPQTGLTPYSGMPAVAASPADEVEGDDDSVFVATRAEGALHRMRRPLMISFVLTVVAVGLVIAWPALRHWWHPIPPDPVESVASEYLQSLIDKNAEVSQRLGTLELPPAIRTYRTVRRDRSRNQRVKGSFAPIATFHARIDEMYTYDPEVKRFTPKNALGPAAETLDALHDAKAKAEQDKVYDKISSGNPDDLFDAAEALAKPLAALSETVLSPKKLLPTYRQLVEQAKPPLATAERTLAFDFAANREVWDQLLKRPFLTLKADGPFVFQRAEVVAQVIDALGSSGDPPTPLRLTLTRFRLEGIDTGWKVTAARREREGEASPAPVEAPVAAPPASPGERSGSRRN